MTIPKVVNIRHGNLAQNNAYIGRGSKWGNPFIIGKDGTREEVIEKYHKYVMSRPDLLNALGEIRGRDLACYCAPRACHGDILLKLANEE